MVLNEEEDAAGPAAPAKALAERASEDRDGIPGDSRERVGGGSTGVGAYDGLRRVGLPPT